ncbi:MAG: hypothetical protein IKB60_01805 [Clostridia bacterium]|nr:hypothetical protein [Clostridia bacterium]
MSAKEHIDKKSLLKKLDAEIGFGEGESGLFVARITERIIDLINKAYIKGYAAGKREVDAVDR